MEQNLPVPRWSLVKKEKTGKIPLKSRHSDALKGKYYMK
jgi:hypothetical protein